MIDCRETLKRFYDYLDRELTQIRAREVEEHLERCRGCFDRFEVEKSFGKFVSTSGQEPVDTGYLKAQIRARLIVVGPRGLWDDIAAPSQGDLRPAPMHRRPPP